MNRSPTIAAARFSSLVPAPIHPMQARLLALVAAHRFATTTQLARLTAPEYASLGLGPAPDAAPPGQPGPAAPADEPGAAGRGLAGRLSRDRSGLPRLEATGLWLQTRARTGGAAAAAAP